MKKIPVRNITSSKEPVSGKFTIRKIQDVLNGRDLQHDIHRHNFFFVLAIQTGEGIHEIDFTANTVSEKSFFLLRPGQVHQLQLKSNASGYLMEFDNDFFHPAEKTYANHFRKAFSKNFYQPEERRFEKLTGILSHIADEFINEQDGYRDVIKAYLEIFFIEFVRQTPDPNTLSINQHPYIQERFEEFATLMEKHVYSNKKVSQYSEMMNLSLYQLNEITKTAVGKTASELINDYIILETKRYLTATSNQVKDIADHLGYEDVSYFIRFFKKHTGHSPDAFRRNFK